MDGCDSCGRSSRTDYPDQMSVDPDGTCRNRKQTAVEQN